MDFQNRKHLLAAAAQARVAYAKSSETTSITDAQEASLRDDPVKGPIWVAKFETPAPEPGQDTSRDLLLSLVDELNDKNIPYERPDSTALKFEWVGNRDYVEEDTTEPAISEEEKFKSLAAENTAPLTVLYIYGGTFVLNTPSCYRRTTSLLSKQTGARVLMVHQRLAPQNPFPAALLDVFQAYFTLLSPPPGSLHAAIPPSQIVIAGDSSGSCLALGVLQILLHLKRTGKKITFHGQTINPATSTSIIPAGLALLSPVSELTNSVPSYTRNIRTDIFPDMFALPYNQLSHPKCALWPTDPPRADLYCEGAMLAHPLASPAASDDWSGACPIWMAGGQEQTVDAARLIAQTASAQGVVVTHYEYEALPHTFFFVWRSAPQSSKVLREWGEAMVGFVSRDQKEGKEKGASRAVVVRAKGLVEEERDVSSLVPFTVGEMRGWMWERTKGFKVPEFHYKKGARL
ncbi:alpha/beta-hydrolase [Aspergillus pseudoustus]|uniref:Alpha/beta-hydrolase n=1 Tax=Aspergillus pseudoustus TaxID=1810923 RepID=A0ABR4IQY9_9EURO